jgi:hypothetical protein
MHSILMYNQSNQSRLHWRYSQPVHRLLCFCSKLNVKSLFISFESDSQRQTTFSVHNICWPSGLRHWKSNKFPAFDSYVDRNTWAVNHSLTDPILSHFIKYSFHENGGDSKTYVESLIFLLLTYLSFNSITFMNTKLRTKYILFSFFLILDPRIRL